MFQSNRVAGEERRFAGAKARGSVPVRHALVHDALVQASLDPRVRAIEHLPSTSFAGSEVALDAIVLLRDDGRFAVDIVEARPLRDIDGEGLALLALQDLGVRLLTLTAGDIRAEPRFSNCRLIWPYRSTRVGVGLRLRILQTLHDEGALRLGALLAAIRSSADPGPAVMALACADLVELGLCDAPLGPATPVRLRT
jgi:hypothetical protein